MTLSMHGPAAVEHQPPTPAEPRSAGYIVGPAYDLLVFVLSPLLAMAVGLLLFEQPLANLPITAGGWNPRFSQPFALFFIAVFTHAHLVIVFFRSHANRKIYDQHPLRFRVAPIALLVAMLTWQWVFVVVGVLVVWWDVYHSSLQTFGLGRIYDVRAGNSPLVGRRLDMLLNLILYTGPVLGGVNLWEHAKHFEAFARVDAHSLASLGQALVHRQPELRLAILGLGIPLLLAWIAFYWRESAAGRYRMPRQKLLLVMATGTTSVVAWGTLSTGEAFFIMNFFHAL